jgi:epoxyqueuosine reductase QueG
MHDLQKELREFAESLNLDLFGVADLASAHDFVRLQGGDNIARFPRAICIGIRLLDAVVDELWRHEEPSAIFTYRGLYDSVNSALCMDEMLIGKKIQEAGFKAYPIPASQEVNHRDHEAAFSHKLAANLAGLGWIGKSCLLITPLHGPRVRLATVLTDAPLEPGTPLPNRCGKCMKCVEACPARAITGVRFDSSEPRDVRFKTQLCDDYTERRRSTVGDPLCALCVYVCPHGAHRSRVDRRTLPERSGGA